MLRSLYSGISGMSVNQTKMDVIANNIANVGTTSFKSGRVRFADMLFQNDSQALSAGANLGGVNAKQVGLGVQIAGIDTLEKQGMMQPTNRPLDAAIDQTGYFMVGKGSTPQSNASGISQNPDHTIGTTGGMSVSYTRDGAFALSNGNLVTSDGYRVLGYALTVQGGPESVNYSNGQVSSVNLANADDPTIKADSTLVPLVIPDSVSRPASNFPAGSNMQVASGDGTAADLPSVSGTYTGTTAVQLMARYTTGSSSWDYSVDGGKTWTAAADLHGNAAATPPLPDLIPGVTVTPGTAPTKDSVYTQNIYPAQADARVISYSIEKDGMINAVLDDGSVTSLGQIAMASFLNPEGLTQTGKNLYSNSPNSGQPTIRSGIGSANDNSAGYGDMLQNMLEMSNVDLASQFTDMIVTSRAFQASSKVITTGDEMLQDILALKR
jgi:flagellar hook protein FlgE